MQFYTSVVQHFDSILVRGYKDGKRYSTAVPYKPYLFEPVEGETGYKTLQGQNVFKRDFENIKEAREYVKKFEGVSGARLFGSTNWAYTYINDRFKGTIDYDDNLIRVLNFDIECLSPNGFPKAEYAAEMITAVTMSSGGTIYSFGLKEYTPTASNIVYTKCYDEKELLHRVIDCWRSIDPDILTGWNIEFFDVPYLVNRIKSILGEEHAKRLSPWEKLKENRSEYNGNVDVSYEIYGIQQLDYLPLYKKFSFTNQETYKLGYIASIVLDEKKLLKHSEIDNAWEENHQLFMEYNIDDVTKIDRFEDKLGMIAMVIANAYDTKTNYQDSFTTVRLWDTIIHNFLLEQGIVVPHGQRRPKTKSIVGGYVKDPDVGRHEFLVSFDYESLYPKTISACNISPETYMGHYDMTVGRALMGGMAEDDVLDFIEQNDCVLTAGGWYYSKSREGFLGRLMDLKFAERKRNKDLMLDAEKKLSELQNPTPEEIESISRDISRYGNKQLALKIQLNACYGALSNEYFRWFDDRLAESITMQGQLCILWLEKRANEYMKKLFTDNDDYVIAMDTDSMYIKFDKFKGFVPGVSAGTMIDTINRFCKDKLQPKINEWVAELEDYCSVYKKSTWRMKREAICDQAIWTGGKNYILSIWDNEGIRYEKPKVKIKGLAAIKSSTAAICRQSLRGAFEKILYGTNDELFAYIADFKKEFLAHPIASQARNSGTTDIYKYADPKTIYKKGSPVHVKGSLIYNHWIDKLGLANKYEKIKDGDKIKWTYLMKPNAINEDVIAFKDKIPAEFNLDNSVDTDLLFVDGFIKPLKAVTDAVGWSVEKVANLDEVF